MEERIWLSWEKFRRNQTISKEFNAKLFQLNSNSLFRYPILLIKTLAVIKKEKPQAIFVQNPSVILSMFGIIISRLFRKKIIVDAHNVGIFFEHKSRIIKLFGQILNIIIIRYASLTIVTNSNLAKYVIKRGGNPFVLPDPFPVFVEHQRIDLMGERNIFCICSFALDEPYLEMVNAADFLDENICIYVSGDNKGVKDLPRQFANNVILTGYVPDSEYINYLYSSDVIVDLTLRDNCLVSGAYEAISVGKSVILSNTSALKEYFSDGALYTDNFAEDIAHKIGEALSHLPEQELKARKIKTIRNEEWLKRKEELEMILNDL